VELQKVQRSGQPVKAGIVRYPAFRQPWRRGPLAPLRAPRYNGRMLSRLRDWHARFMQAATLGVRGVVLAEGDRVLLVKHSYGPGWHFPGGGVERGETFVTALARELEEEGGIVLAGAPTLHGLYFYPRHSNRDHVALFVVRSFREIARAPLSREIAACGFFPVDDLPPDATAPTRARLAEILHGEPVAERW
jgi:8-oxo-dGTP pyrophosphatase MutT (NUDIX family)